MQITEGVHRFGNRLVNWYILEEGGRLTLIDAGMPGHWRQLTAALGGLGRTPADIDAIVLTHAHADHIGFTERARKASSARVLVHQADNDPGRRRFPPLHLYWRPSSWPMLAHGLANGLLITPNVATAAS